MRVHRGEPDLLWGLGPKNGLHPLLLFDLDDVGHQSGELECGLEFAPALRALGTQDDVPQRIAHGEECGAEVGRSRLFRVKCGVSRRISRR